MRTLRLFEIATALLALGLVKATIGGASKVMVRVAVRVWPSAKVAVFAHEESPASRVKT
jgi:hypothetical protein